MAEKRRLLNIAGKVDLMVGAIIVFYTIMCVYVSIIIFREFMSTGIFELVLIRSLFLMWALIAFVWYIYSELIRIGRRQMASESDKKETGLGWISSGLKFTARKGETLSTSIIILIGIIGISITVYLWWFQLSVMMGIFDRLFDNGWWYVYMWIIGLFFSIFNVKVYQKAWYSNIYVNLGGCIVPLVTMAYLLNKFWNLMDAGTFIAATLGIIALSWFVSFYVRGVGIVIIALIVELASAMISVNVNQDMVTRLVFGYAISTLGVLIGGDLFKAYQVEGSGSIGGAGTKDGIWTIGLTTMFIIVLMNIFLGW